MSVVASEMLTVSNAAQLRKASRSIFCTFLGTMKFFRPQSANAPLPMVRISASSANVAVAIFSQPLKALLLIVVTVLGNSNFSNSFKLAKALWPMVFNGQLPWMLKAFSFVLALNALSEISSSCEPLGTLIVSRFQHPGKATPIFLRCGKGYGS